MGELQRGNRALEKTMHLTKVTQAKGAEAGFLPQDYSRLSSNKAQLETNCSSSQVEHGDLWSRGGTCGREKLIPKSKKDFVEEEAFDQQLGEKAGCPRTETKGKMSWQRPTWVQGTTGGPGAGVFLKWYIKCYGLALHSPTSQFCFYLFAD